MSYLYWIVPIGEFTPVLTSATFAAYLTTAWPQASIKEVDSSTGPAMRWRIPWIRSAETSELLGGHFYPPLQRLEIMGSSQHWVDVVLWYRRITPPEHRLRFHALQETQLEVQPSTTAQDLLQLFLPDLTADAWELLTLLQAMGGRAHLHDLVERLQRQWPTEETEAFITRADAAFNQVWRLEYMGSSGMRWNWSSEKRPYVEHSIRPVLEHPKPVYFQFQGAQCVTSTGEQALHAKQALET